MMMYSGWDKHLHDSLFVGLDKILQNIIRDSPMMPLTIWSITGTGMDVLSFDPGVHEHYTGHKHYSQQVSGA